MDNQKTNQWLRSSLEDYRPVPGGDNRAKFLEAAALMPKKSAKGSRINRWWLLALLFIPLIAASIFIILPFNELVDSAQPSAQRITQPNPQTSPLTQQNEVDNNSFTNPVISESTETVQSSTFSEKEDVSALAYTQTPETPDSKENSQFVSLKISTDEDPMGVLNYETPVKENDSSVNSVEGSVSSVLDTNQNQINEPDSTIVNEPIPHATQMEAESAQSNGFTDTPKFKNRKNYLAYGVYYRPELVYNLIESDKLTNSFGVEIQYRFFNDRYSIRTGAGLSISKGYYEYATEYQQYLGAYDKLDSISFAWDDRQYNLLPTYYLSEQEVFEDTLTTTYSKIYKTHYYLQLPMILGYDFISGKNFRVGLRAGPRLSLLVDSKRLNSLGDSGKNKVIQINQITHDRIKANWQFVGAINIGVMTRGRFFVEVEPEFTYYFNSVYQSPELKKNPWSVGLRIAVGIR